MTNLRVAPAGLSMTFGNGAKAKVEAVGEMVLKICYDMASISVHPRQFLYQLLCQLLQDET